MKSKAPTRKRPATLAREAETFNRDVPVGTPVRYWKGFREGPGIESRTRSPAEVFAGHTAVVWVVGYGSCIALSHIEVITPEPPRAA